MKRPDDTGVALMQSLHVLNEWENGLIYSLNADVPAAVPTPVHPYAWGLFKTTLLKATKDRQDLKEWAPHLFDGHTECHHCRGQGQNPIPQDSEQYREYLEDNRRREELIANGTFERTSLDTPFNDGDPLWSHCSPCQGSGVLTAYDRAWEAKK